jgi:hypothetical protein
MNPRDALIVIEGLATVVLGLCVGLVVLEHQGLMRRPELIALNLREEPGKAPTPAVIYRDAA